MMVRAGGSDEFRSVQLTGIGFGRDLPAGYFLDVITPFTQAEPVGGCGGAAAAVWVGMIAMADGCVAVRCPAALVTQADEIG